MIDFCHPDLGAFDGVEDEPNAVKGEIEWCGHPTRLKLCLEGSGSFDDAATHALALRQNDRLWEIEFKERIHEELFATWTESWRDGEPVLPKEVWTGRLAADSLEVTDGGDFTMYFKDGDLFWGHWIEVFGSILNGTPKVSLVG